MKKEKCDKEDKDIYTETIGYCIKEKDHEGICFFKRVKVEI